MKITLFVTVFNFIFVINKSYCQDNIWNFTDNDSSSCYALQIFEKNIKQYSVDDLNPIQNPFGIIIIKNGVYNFKSNGHKYFLYKVDSITKNNIHISKLTDTTQSHKLSIDEKFEIVISSLHNGRDGWPPPKMSSNKFEFKIIQSTIFCKMPSTSVCVDLKCTDTVISNYRYMTAGSTGLPIYFYNGKYFMRDETTIYPIK